MANLWVLSLKTRCLASLAAGNPYFWPLLVANPGRVRMSFKKKPKASSGAALTFFGNDVAGGFTESGFQ
jgi:hypothetical protein